MEFVTDKYVKNLLAGVLKKVKDKFSTDEVKIGTWIDGRDIYRKTFTDVATPQCKTKGTAVYTSIDVSDLDIDVVVNMYGETHADAANNTRTIPYHYFNGYPSIQLDYDATNKLFRVGNSATDSGYLAAVIDFICIEYVKVAS